MPLPQNPLTPAAAQVDPLAGGAGVPSPTPRLTPEQQFDEQLIIGLHLPTPPDPQDSPLEAQEKAQRGSFMGDAARLFYMGALTGIEGDVKVIDVALGGTRATERTLDFFEEHKGELWEAMSPETQKAAQKRWFGEDESDAFFGDAWTDWRAYELVGLQGAGSIATMFLTGGPLKKVASGGLKWFFRNKTDDLVRQGMKRKAAERLVAHRTDIFSSATAYGLAETGMVSGQIIIATEDAIMEMPQEILEKSDIYQAVKSQVDEGLPTLGDNERAFIAKTIVAKRLGKDAGFNPLLLATTMGLGAVGGTYLHNAIFKNMKGPAIARIAKTFAAESQTEGMQGLSEQIAENIYVGKIDKARKLTEDLLENYWTEALGGGLAGGPLGALPGKKPDKPGEPPPTPTLDELEKGPTQEQVDQDAIESTLVESPWKEALPGLPDEVYTELDDAGLTGEPAEFAEQIAEARESLIQNPDLPADEVLRDVWGSAFASAPPAVRKAIRKGLIEAATRPEPIVEVKAVEEPPTAEEPPVKEAPKAKEPAAEKSKQEPIKARAMVAFPISKDKPEGPGIVRVVLEGEHGVEAVKDLFPGATAAKQLSATEKGVSRFSVSVPSVAEARATIQKITGKPSHVATEGVVEVKPLPAKVEVAPKAEKVVKVAAREEKKAERRVAKAERRVKEVQVAEERRKEGRRDIILAAKEVEVPTEAQAEAGNYKKGHVKLHGFDITIETAKGAKRKGPGWEVTMPHHYGYIRGTEGADGEQVDIHLGPLAERPDAPIFVVEQTKPDSPDFDESKVMMGFSSMPEAKKAYLASFQGDFGQRVYGGIRKVSLEELKNIKSDTQGPDTINRPAEEAPGPPKPAKEPTKKPAEPAPKEPVVAEKPAKEPVKEPIKVEPSQPKPVTEPTTKFPILEEDVGQDVSVEKIKPSDLRQGDRYHSSRFGQMVTVERTETNPDGTTRVNHDRGQEDIPESVALIAVDSPRPLPAAPKPTKAVPAGVDLSTLMITVPVLVEETGQVENIETNAAEALAGARRRVKRLLLLRGCVRTNG